MVNVYSAEALKAGLRGIHSLSSMYEHEQPHMSLIDAQ